MEYESNRWIWDGVYYYPHFFGGLMLTAALLGVSTSYFGGIGVFSLPHLWSDSGIFHTTKCQKKKCVRVYMDGCFDLMHYGHANALRQAKALGDELVVGVISDEEIVANKGPPVLSMEERLALVSGLKWVDEVIADAPYAITEQFMNRLFNEYKIDYIIHGDDPCLLPDGTDAYSLAKKVGRYKQIKRTEGVSSTDIVGRILSSVEDTKTLEILNATSLPSDPLKAIQSKHAHISQFLPTSRRIVQFSNCKGPGPNARVVYIDGAFDLFHAGHVEILNKARQLGDFLLVGIYTDQIVSEHRGNCHPIMHLHERSLSVLACRYVDEVIIGAPWEVMDFERSSRMDIVLSKMDIVLSNSKLLFRQPLPPLRTVTWTHRPTKSSSNNNQQLMFVSRTKLSLKPRTVPNPKLAIRCGASSGITEINQNEFPNTVLKSERPVLVEFVANWCGPCRLIAPAIESLSQEYGDRLKVVKIDHDANPQLIEEYKVYGLPTLILFKNGQEVPESRREGAITKVKLKEYIDSLLDSISVS